MTFTYLCWQQYFNSLQVPAYLVHSEFVAEFILLLFSNVATEFIIKLEFV